MHGFLNCILSPRERTRFMQLVPAIAMWGWRERTFLFSDICRAWLSSVLASSSIRCSQPLCVRDSSIPLQGWGNLASVRLKDLPNDTYLASHCSLGFHEIQRTSVLVPWDLRRTLGPPTLFWRTFSRKSGLRLPSSGLPSFGLLHQPSLPPIWSLRCGSSLTATNKSPRSGLCLLSPIPTPELAQGCQPLGTLSSQFTTLSTSSWTLWRAVFPDYSLKFYVIEQLN